MWQMDYCIIWLHESNLTFVPVLEEISAQGETKDIWKFLSVAHLNVTEDLGLKVAGSKLSASKDFSLWNLR